jgi:hypothetical protein
MKEVLKKLKEVKIELSFLRKDTAGLSGFQSKLRELIFEVEQLKIRKNENI